MINLERPKILAVIPARGGSKGIPRKNVRLIAGKPLIAYSIALAQRCECIDLVAVTTDDEEIARIAQLYGAQVVDRPSELATDSVTLDPVINHATIELENRNNSTFDVVVTLQPTSPLLSVRTLNTAIECFIRQNYDTIISGVNRPHLSWTIRNGEYVPLYGKRLNRQQLPINIQETGAFVISRRRFITESSRFGPNLSLFEMQDDEAVDIDTVHDWWIAEREISKKLVFVRTDGYPQIGMGHIYRGLLLAYSLIDHNIRFILSSRHTLGIVKVRDSHFPFDLIEGDDDFFALVAKYKPDIIINDILDTTRDYISRLKTYCNRIVNFEDLGSGADYADAVINALYEKQKEGKNYYWGSDYYCIRDEFLLARPKAFQERVDNVLIIFGGTDPSNLTGKLLSVIMSLPQKLGIKFTIVLGMGYEKTLQVMETARKCNREIEVFQQVNLMTTLMARADLAVSSQGRTMFELARMGVPTILLAQNQREMHHEFGNLPNGFINLGLGSEVDECTIRETIMWLLKAPQIRQQMRERMLSTDLTNGINRVRKIILGETGQITEH